MDISKTYKAAAQKECQNLIQNQTGIIAAVIASEDGFDVASTVTKNANAEKIAAMASSIAAIGSVVSSEISTGESESITIKTKDGFAYITYLEFGSLKFILNVVADSSAILAQVIYQCSEIRKRLSRL